MKHFFAVVLAVPFVASSTSAFARGGMGLRLAGPAHNLIGADTVCAQQDDLGPPDMLMRCVAIRTTVLRRRRSTGLRKMEIPVRMRQTCMQRARRESLPGFKCQI